MYNPETYLNATIEDIVFENRNKAYGAYQLRKDTSKFATYALGFGFFATLLFSVFTLKASKSPEITIIPDVIANPTDIIIDVPQKIELPPVEAPAPPTAKPQPTIAYTEFVVKQDNKVIDDKEPTIDDLKGKAISTITNDLPPTGGDEPIIEKGKVVSEPIIKKEETFTWVEQFPEYNGGQTALYKYIASEIKYPKIALSNGIEGTVYVSFVIDTEGNVSEISTTRGIGFGCDEAAEEVIAKMQKWFPGKQNGKPVRVRMTLPIKFEAID